MYEQANPINEFPPGVSRGKRFCRPLTLCAAINKTASYLGDAVLRQSQIRRIVNDQFQDKYEIDGESISLCTENVLKMTSHPLIFAFTAGAGTARYGSAQ